METPKRLRVVVATPLSESLCERIKEIEPRVDLIRDQTLLPPMRFAADFSGDPTYVRSPEQQRRFEYLIDSADVLYGIPDVDPAALRRAVTSNPRLRWVQTMAAGGGGQVKAAGLSDADLNRVVFTTSAGVHGGPLAEFAVFGLLSGAKTMPRLLAQQQQHSWSHRWEMAQLSDQTILILGLGGIGREVARKLAALDVHVVGMSRRDEQVPGVAELVRPEDLRHVLPRIDGVVVTLPGTDATYKFVDDSFLSGIMRGATVVSVGRGTVIDEDALIAALQDGRVGFAALDVFAVEPLESSSPLWDLPNVILSPHTAGLDPREEQRIADLFARNAGNLLDGKPLVNIVDTVEFY